MSHKVWTRELFVLLSAMFHSLIEPSCEPENRRGAPDCDENFKQETRFECPSNLSTGCLGCCYWTSTNNTLVKQNYYDSFFRQVVTYSNVPSINDVSDTSVEVIIRSNLSSHWLSFLCVMTVVSQSTNIPWDTWHRRSLLLQSHYFALPSIKSRWAVEPVVIGRGPLLTFVSIDLMVPECPPTNNKSPALDMSQERTLPKPLAVVCNSFSVWCWHVSSIGMRRAVRWGWGDARWRCWSRCECQLTDRSNDLIVWSDDAE